MELKEKVNKDECSSYEFQINFKRELDKIEDKFYESDNFKKFKKLIDVFKKNNYDIIFKFKGKEYFIGQTPIVSKNVWGIKIIVPNPINNYYEWVSIKNRKIINNIDKVINKIGNTLCPEYNKRKYTVEQIESLFNEQNDDKQPTTEDIKKLNNSLEYDKLSRLYDIIDRSGYLPAITINGNQYQFKRNKYLRFYEFGSIQPNFNTTIILCNNINEVKDQTLKWINDHI
jgi:hypothetical protein